MFEHDTAAARGAGDAAAAIAIRRRLKGTNINDKSLLATDYLNHFNEIVMVLDLIPDLPDCIEEARAWRPKSYKAHFRDSSFSDKDLAIEAYDHAPADTRRMFEDTVARMDRLVAHSLDRIEDALATGDGDFIRISAAAASRRLQHLIDVVSAIINGEKTTIGQDEIDAILER